MPEPRDSDSANGRARSRAGDSARGRDCERCHTLEVGGEERARLAALEAHPAVAAARAELGADRGAWLVGGAVRDALIGRPFEDVDIVVAADPRGLARAIARRLGAVAFELSREFGQWRVQPRAGGGWTLDVAPVVGSDLADDLARRDFTVNALAVPLTTPTRICDPTGGLSALRAGIIELVSPYAFRDDPVRLLRLARLRAEIGFVPSEGTRARARQDAALVASAPPERLLQELRRLLAACDPLAGIELLAECALLEHVLPELAALRGVEQSHFHHLDVYEHTLEVLRCLLDLERAPQRVCPDADASDALARVLAEPLADGFTRGTAVRFAALLHDIGKPATRAVRPDGRVTFVGHDEVGARMTLALCRRLRTSERLARFLADLARHHLALGFLVHERPLDRGRVYDYLRRCEPVEVEVTFLSCADRLATRGRNAERAIAAHLDLARELMAAALAWRAAGGAPRPPLRGDELARALGIAPGPQLGRLLESIRRAVYAGEVSGREEAVAYARRLCADQQTDAD